MSDQGSQGLLSPFLRKQRLTAAKRWLRGSVLDYGCGSGTLAAYVPASRYCGVDRDPDAIKIAQRDFPQHTFALNLTDEGKFDTIVSLAVIEHIPHPKQLVLQLRDLLNENGSIVLTTPNKKFEAIHELGAKIGIFSADAADEHESLFDETSLRTLAIDCGMKVRHFQYFLMGANQLLIMDKS